MSLRFWVITVATLLTALSSAAQQQRTTEDLIDGAKHPEQISDTTAYRLFLAAYAGADDQHRMRQNSLFDAIGLVKDDRLVLTAALDDFDLRFRQILDDDAKAVSFNPNTDHMAFHIQRDMMMDNVVASLKTQMSTYGFQLLNRYVQVQKKRMRVSPELERRRIQ